MSVFLESFKTFQAPSLNALPLLGNDEVYYLAWQMAKECKSIIQGLSGAALDEYLYSFHDAGVSLAKIRNSTAEGLARRLTSPKFWRKKINSIADALREHQAMLRGLIGGGHSSYCSNETFHLREELESKVRFAGQYMLKTHGDACSDNPYLHMDGSRDVRVKKIYLLAKAMEELSRRRNFACLMLTLMCPPEFHSNPEMGDNSFAGASPREAHDYLRCFYEKLFKSLEKHFKAGVDYFGLRITELHKDGCPHWHIVIFFKDGFKERLEQRLESLYLGDPRWKENHFSDNKHKIVKVLDESLPGAPSFIPYVFKTFFNPDTKDKVKTQEFEESRSRIRFALKAGGAKAFSLIGMDGVQGKIDLVRKALRDSSASAEVRDMARRLVVSKKDPCYKRKQLNALVDFIDKDISRLVVVKKEFTNKYGETVWRSIGVRVEPLLVSHEGDAHKGGVTNNYSRKSNVSAPASEKPVIYPVGVLPARKRRRRKRFMVARNLTRAPP